MAGSECTADIIRMDLILNVIVVVGRNDVVDEIGFDVIDECRSESIFHVARAWRSVDERMERM